jgi:hypothetical protein
MTGDEKQTAATARDAVEDARRDAARAQARLARAGVRYADERIAETSAAADSGLARLNRAKPGEFVADELAAMLREQPYQVRCLLARSRRLAADLPTVWEAFKCGELDAEQIRVIDRIARRVTEPSTLAALDEQAVDAAQTRSPKQLAVWLLRLVVQLEPLAFEQRHRRALAERRVTVIQGVDGLGYVTGEVSAADAAAIDGMLAAAARSLGAADPRTEQQRRKATRRTGWKSKTLTPRPVSCWARMCSVWMVMVSPWASRSMPPPRGREQFRHLDVQSVLGSCGLGSWCR